MIAKAMNYLEKDLLLHMGMIEAIQRETAELIYASGDGVLLKEVVSGAYMISVENLDIGKQLMASLTDCELIVIHQPFMIGYIQDHIRLTRVMACFQSVYLKKDKLTMSHDLVIKKITRNQIDIILSHYNKISKEELSTIIEKGMLYGGYYEDELVGFIGIHLEGSIGILEVFAKFRRRGYGSVLQSYVTNLMLAWGWTPFAQVVVDNHSSIELQKKLGFQLSDKILYWMF